MTPEMYAVLAAGLVIGALAEYFAAKKWGGGNVDTARAAAMTEIADLRAAWGPRLSALEQGAAERFHELTARAALASPVPAAAPAVAPVPWTLGDSYTSVTALAADIQRPDFTREVRINNVPAYNVGGADPVNFYSVGDTLSQTKPA